jgi:uncharacterized protein GlcG (DUF336 family)
MLLKKQTPASAVIFLMAAAAPDATAFSQDLITHKGLSLDVALLVAQGALMKHHAEGYRDSLIILDSGTGLHPLGHSRRKAYTTLTFKRTSTETAKAWAVNPNHPLIGGTVSAAGGAPIQTSTEVVVAIGVSGDKDEACALTAIAKISDSLK